MPTRPVAAVTGALLGFSALLLPLSTAQAAERQSDPVVVAHRGASGYAPENTLAAADKAHQLGIDWVENDVQRTSDGKLVVIHDTDLTRTTDVEEVFPDRAPWSVSDFTLAEIRKLDAGSWFSADYAGEKVPTLREFLRKMTRNQQKLLLEIKAPELYPGIEAQILGELRGSGWLDRRHVRDRLILQSFGAESVRTVHTLRPDVKTGFLGTPDVSELPAYAEFTDQINPSYRTVTADYVDAVHQLKGAHGKPLELFTWTVNDGAVAADLAGLGVDGIITNTPDVVRDAVSGSGAPRASEPVPAGS
ncbi:MULTISPECIES: glycerophosphodiester phosphodiesterase family protein [Streptomyces]|uniref:Glycerophosphodiester phosphodiesterase n=1 Tax=Streptomyces lycii TaxID=2654337 RepID=A0ABQ7FFF6_9ACTN|nr:MULTISPECIES: glycerophosphodiester phosphodiesterase family protein [Streptomyces]KAF4407253.1 glycerophosphodiester phosphodiesterase [Streptomyces lycii]PGH50908.1 glycerophosphodiester phosphodiesterase [Streptomyces sp. Ru87]